MKVSKATLQALREILAFERGEKTDVRVAKVTIGEIDVRVIRESLHLSQREFAELYGFELATVQNWEQGRRKPEGPAKTLLQLISSKPEVVAAELRRARSAAAPAARA